MTEQDKEPDTLVGLPEKIASFDEAWALLGEELKNDLGLKDALKLIEEKLGYEYVAQRVTGSPLHRIVNKDGSYFFERIK